MTPIVCKLTPETVAVTAHLRIAPTAMRMRLPLIPMRSFPIVDPSEIPDREASETSARQRDLRTGFKSGVAFGGAGSVLRGDSDPTDRSTRLFKLVLRRGCARATSIHTERGEPGGIGLHPCPSRLCGPPRHTAHDVRGHVELAALQRLVRTHADIRVPGRDAGTYAALQPGLARAGLVAERPVEHVAAHCGELAQRVRPLAGEIERLVLVPR